MSVEYEYRIPSDGFDFKAIIKKSKELGGKPIEWSLLVNDIYVLPNSSIVRIRSIHSGTGKKKTMSCLLTVKSSTTIDNEFPTEHESFITDPIAIIEIMRIMKVPKKHTMEKLRGTIVIPGHGILDFDLNPGLPSVLEVECTTKGKLVDLIQKLNIKKPSDDVRARSVLEGQYEEHFGIDKIALKKRFDAKGLQFSSECLSLVLEMISEDRDKKTFTKTFNEQRAMADKFRK